MANLSNINGKFVVEQTTGYVGIGITDPSQLLHLQSTADTILKIDNITSGTGKSYLLQSTTAGSFVIRDEDASSNRLLIDTSGNATFVGQVKVDSTNPIFLLNESDQTANNRLWGFQGQQTLLKIRAYPDDLSSAVDALTLTRTGNATFAGNITVGTNANIDNNLTVSGGNITLGGTGRIQGVDTVSAGTDAANKAYVDSQVGANNELSEVLANGNTTGGTNISVSAGDDIDFTDTSEARFGSGQDLIIKHTGTTGSVTNFVGNLNIVNNANDSDIRFFTDDGVGGITTYFEIDGGSQINNFYQHTRTIDNKYLGVGSSLDMYMLHDGTNSFIRNGTGNLTIEQQVDDGDIIFKSDNGSGGTETYYYLDGSEQLNRFQKGILIPDNVHLSLGNSFDLKIYHDGTHSHIINNTGDLTIDSQGDDLLLKAADDFNVYVQGSDIAIQAIGDGKVGLRYNNVEKFATTNTGVTVTGTAKNNGIEIESAVPSILFNETDVTANWRNRVQAGSYRVQYASNGTTFLDYFVLGANAFTLEKDTTFTEQAFSAATSSGDASSTLTTKGYVDSLITGATIYRGTWDPDVSLNSGYGNPNLNTVTQTSGYYYICSADGAATPNGTGNEPDSWNTGDWVIWNDDIGTGEWQKIDNSSVLSGVGTGQTVALWQGASSVTDSETLGNAPITVSGNNSTFAGDIKQGNRIVLQDNGTIQWGATANYGNLSWDTGYALIYGQSGNGIKFGTNGNTLALTLDTSQNATFAGDIMPSSDSTNDIGSNSVRWDRIYADNLYGVVDQLTVNSNDTFSGTYSLLWHAGATVYSSSFMTINGTTDTLSVPNISTGNATFAGSVTINNNTPLIVNGTDPLISFQNSATNHWQVGLENTNSDRFVFYDNNAAAYQLILESTSGNATFSGDVTVNGSHLKLLNHTGAYEGQSTDYLYIGGSGLNNADAAIYLGNAGNNTGYGWRFYYEGTGSGNNNKLIIKSENAGSGVDALAFTQDGNATFARRVGINMTAGTVSTEIKGRSSDGKSLRLWDNGGTDILDLYNDGTNAYINTTHSGGAGNPLIIKTNSITALTLDTSQNATFAGDINVGGTLYKSSGDFNIKGSAVRIKGITTNENLAAFIENGQVELYHDNSKKFETTSTGIAVSGTSSTFAGNVKVNLVSSVAGAIAAFDSSGNTIWLTGRSSDGESSVSFRNNADSAYNGRIATTDTLMKFSQASDYTFDGNVTLAKAVGDTELLIEADTNNNNENYNPRLHLRQDGGAISAYFGLNGDADNTFTGALANGAYIRAAGSIQFANGSGTDLAMTIDTSQNVGIGTTSPNTKTEIKETNNDIYQLTIYNSHVSTTAKTRIGNWANETKISSNLMQSGGTKTQDDATIASWVLGLGGGTDYYDISRSPAGSTTLSSLMRITSSGNVGIGTTSPGSKLEIFGGGNTLRMDSAGNTAKTFLMRNVNTATAEIKTDGNLDINIEDASRTMRFLNGNTERMRIESTGVVKFPNTATSTGDVGTIAHYTNNYMYIRGGTSGLAIGDDGFGVSVYLNNSDSIQFNTGNGTEKMRIDSSGQIIFKGTGNSVDLRFKDISAAISSETAGYIGMSTSGYSGNNGDLVLIPRTSSASNILLMQGNVGIGTTTPGAKLQVKVGSAFPLHAGNACGNVGIGVTSTDISGNGLQPQLTVKGNISYGYNNYSSVANTWSNALNFSGYPAGLYQVNICKQSNASAYIIAQVKWSGTAGTVINTVTSFQYGITFSGTQLQSIINTTTATSISVQCLVTFESCLP